MTKEDKIRRFFEEGRLLKATQRYDRAVKVFSKIIKQWPLNIEAYYLRALCYQYMGKQKRVDAEFKRIEKLWNENPKIWKTCWRSSIGNSYIFY